MFPKHIPVSTDARPSSEYLAGLRGRRIAVVATGSIAAMYLPAWLQWLNAAVPELSTRVILSRSSLGFVGRDAVSAFAQAPVLIDEWGDAVREAQHVELGEWAEAFVVHPATMDFVSRVSAGLCNSPTLLAMQGSLAPIVLAAAAPPGFTDSPVWTGYVSALRDRPNVHLLAPEQGVSARNRDREGSPPKTFPIVLEYLNDIMEGRDER